MGSPSETFLNRNRRSACLLSAEELLNLVVVERTFAGSEVSLGEPHDREAHGLKIVIEAADVRCVAVAVGQQRVVGQWKIDPCESEVVLRIGGLRIRFG